MSSKVLFYALLASIAAVLLPQLARAQQPVPKPGYLVTEAGDTLRGIVKLARFVTDYGVKIQVGDGPAQDYTVNNARAFATADGRHYRRRRVSFLVNQPIVRQDNRVKSTDSTAVFLQELVVGKARLYRLDYRLHPDQVPLEYTQYETTFYYLQSPNSSLVMLRSDTHERVLWQMFQDCPAIQPTIRGVALEGVALTRLVLRYNTTCGAGFNTPQALALTPKENETRIRFGIRAGVAIDRLNYSDSYYLNDTEFGSKANWMAGISLTISSQHRVSLATGLYFTARRNQRDNTHVVPAGFTNKGQTLVLPSETAVNTIQVPLLATIALTKKAAGMQPFVSLGVLPGVAFSNTVRLAVPTSTFESGNFLPTQAAMLTNGLGGDSKMTPLLGFQASAGVAPRLGSQAVVAELYYELGRQLVGSTGISGKFTYQAVGLRVGIDF